MSLSVSGVHTVSQGPPADSSLSSASQASSASHLHGASTKPSVPSSSEASAIPTLTLAERVEQLEKSGLNNEQIATSLGLTLTQVLTSLHENTSTTQSSAPDLEALSARLSVKA